LDPHIVEKEASETNTVVDYMALCYRSLGASSFIKPDLTSSTEVGN
jgi:hypothetical protein